LSGEELKRLPPAAQKAVEELLMPVYREMVLAAGSGLEQSLAEPYLYLWWRELIREFRTTGILTKRWYDRSTGDPDAEWELDRILATLKERLKVAQFLLRAKQIREEARPKDTARKAPARALDILRPPEELFPITQVQNQA
jgi:hypothetical protein